MAQLVKALAIKPENKRLIPGTLLLEGENQLLQVAFTPNLHYGTCAHIQTNKKKEY